LTKNLKRKRNWKISANHAIYDVLDKPLQVKVETNCLSFTYCWNWLIFFGPTNPMALCV